ncbi:nicotinate-nucleotide--dimethylbenzimidazole phosphoribosyltransferase [Pseudogemmobacter faecipullorum]|uniref:Nicotinate-nucleotide--dimethylbenzimidazole phosphoribosyltransferase n=1 Tax=Pseudogemmobacter faecipullorum TaxID=2755041 RepID=A0ABS8CG86_9RHOB|nr:nicotinate-nucleotide--dimethylbenzimidazole phosphoribosyltransferase [Pseudogemmobacter faecipullorum]MCB5408401.1 nicotinate-nucleotide--dimethylbenzimidazole phosphoribosyltransferase [Pseudogemmobacter faecipullorum]
MSRSLPPADLAGFCSCLDQLPAPDDRALQGAQQRDASLTKPRGALGRLEEIVLWLAAWQGRALPQAEAVKIVIFAGNHGVTARGVSAFPAAVTAQMVANFRQGGAAINQLARAFGARLEVVELDLERPTADFCAAPAMGEAELVAALRAGWNAVEPGLDLFIAGEMGIGNTTSAAALAAALFGDELGVSGWCGRGTGVDDAGLARKEAAVALALQTHAGALRDPFEILRRLGGREVAAMTGAILRARLERVPVLLDGFIACAAAAVLERARPGALDHCFAAHQSAEGAHARLLAAIGKEPLMSLGLRLGEASGAGTALGLVQAALACHRGMASFAEAGVSGKGL